MTETKLKGLTSREVRRLRLAGLYNKSVAQSSRTVREIVLSNLLTYFNFVFLFLALILILVGSFRDLTFLPIIIANTLIGILQELRAKAVLDRLTLLNAPHAKVIRNGNLKTVSVERLVLGDIVFLQAGNQIPADAVIVEGDVNVNEALLTGEEDEVHKEKLGELLSGSFVVSGECYAQLTKVGAESYAAQLTLQAKEIKTGEQSEIIRSLNKIVKLAGIAIIPIGIILFIQGYFFSEASAKESVQAMVAAIIGMIPEGLFLLSSVTLAISATRLALGKVLLHDMRSIETLARVDTLCVDKTGTITDGEMDVSELIVLSGKKAAAEQIIGDLVRAQKSDTTTMEALKRFFSGFATTKRIRAQKILGFSSRYKYSGAEFGKDTYVLGAPEAVLGDSLGKHAAQIDQYSKQGMRVIAVSRYGGKLDGQKLTAKLEPIALIVLRNRIRESAPETFAYFAKQGVDIKVISGDNPITVAAIAQQAGIKGASNYIDASKLTTEKELAAAIKKYTVFGRVTPEQKRKMVRALQRADHTVAMTGDGVNDILALKDADCSIAMASGSDAAVQAAQLVLLESDFSKMPTIVAEGRRVVNNLERSGSLFLVKNVFSFIMAVLAIIFSFTYPLIPTQVSLVTLWTIGVPSFLLAQIPNHRLIKGRFVDNILLHAVPAGMTNVVLVSLMVIFGSIFGFNGNDIGTGCTIVMATVGLVYLFKICQPFNLYKRLIWGLSALGMLLCTIFMKELFGLSANMTIWALLTCLIIATLSIPTLMLMQKFFNWARHRFYRHFLPKLVRYGQKISKVKLAP